MAYKPMQYDRKTAKVARYYDRVKGGENGIPISLQVALCDACFNRCIMCGHPERPVMHKMDARKWVEKLDWFLGQGSERGLETVCYSGGDPMAYPDFNIVMQAHVDKQIDFGMTITGYVPPTIDLALMARARWVRVSLDAITPEVYAKCRGKTPVEKVIRSIDAMLGVGVPVGLGITVHADNADDLPNVMEFARQRGITDIETHHIVPDSGPRATPIALAWERKIEPFQHCHAALYQLYIDAAGDVYPCCITAGDAQAAPQAYALGNLWRDDWYGVIWPAVVAYTELKYTELPPICRSCCIQRLSQVNSICDQIASENDKSFF